MRHTFAPLRTTLAAGLTIAAINLALLGIGHLLGADMQVAQSAADTPTAVSVGSVLLMSFGPMILGGLTLWLAARRGLRAWHAVGWLGLALGLLTTPMPFAVVATTGTSMTLSSMHVVAGLVWFTLVRRAAPPQHDRSALDGLVAEGTGA